MSYDHGDWVDLYLVDRDGNKTNLSELKPLAITQGYGQTRVNRSNEDNPLRIAGTEYKTGFGTHANGTITFQLDKEYVAFEGAVGVDDEVTQTGSIRFYIKTVPQQEKTLLEAKLSPRLDRQGVAKHTAPGQSPWRLVIVAPKAIDLVDQTILMNVSQPADSNVDWSWIKPGIGSWDWWSDSNVHMNTDSIKHFIEFASEMGWQYTFVDDPWYAGKKYRMGDPRNNVLKGSDEVDMEEVVQFAREKNVRLFLWLNWKDIDRQMEEAFALYEKWGIAGVKIDFMDSDDQQMVEWYDKTVEMAAKYHLMVDYHGAYKPTGYRRAHPNLITREGIFGNEQNKWTRITPEQYCVFPYTRLILGPGDFTPGAFINRHYDGQGSQIEGVRTAQGVGTRAHELAISFLYDSPILCLCDRPEVYRDQPGLEYYRNLPTVWDESHAVAGEIGEYFSLIRRKGNDWYYGAITKDARELTLSLDFLRDGDYEATIYADTAETDRDARSISITTKTVTSNDSLDVNMVRCGGQTIVFKKK
jgi:alpha-glucosidase